MNFGSVCSGIEAASVAWGPLGWKAAWLAEIEPFPSAVLAHHYPEVPNLGDMTTIARRVLTGEVEAPDMFCGGTPCQAFSVAGLRQSLDDERGNLTLKFVGIANAIDHVRTRAGKPACIVFWENVPGVLSTKDNAFGCFLAGLAGEDDPLEPPGAKWANAGAVFGPTRTVAWRTLDAQYFGVAQRRRRVFVVASARDGFDPYQVLFEWDGLRRDSAPRREAGEGTAAGVEIGPGGGRFTDLNPTLDTRAKDGPIRNQLSGAVMHPVAYGGNNQSGPIDVATARNACASASGRMDFETETFLVQPVAVQASQSGVRVNETIGTLDANYGSRRHNGVMVPVAFDTTQITIKANYSNPHPGDPFHPLAGGAHAPAAAFPANLSGTQHASTKDMAPAMGATNPTAVAFAIQAGALRTNPASGPDGVGVQSDHAYTLEARSEVQAVAVSLRGREGGATAEMGDNVQNCLRASGGGGDKPHVLTAMQVRRLTPRECEALQGFPLDYTAIPWRKKPASECPDGPRYKALGNSWAVPVVRWIGARISHHARRAA